MTWVSRLSILHVCCTDAFAGVERHMAALAADQAARGHEVHRWTDWEWRAGGVCVARIDASGVRWGAADPRRDSYAVAW